MRNYDVVIIGGGPAGISCSICLSKGGRSSLIIEQNHSLHGKVCGDALTVSSIRLLKKLGMDPIEIEGKKVYSKIIYKSGKREEFYFSDLFGADYEYGVSRDLLNDYMLNSALKSGAEIVWNHRCRSIRPLNQGYCIDGIFQANEVVLACGAIGLRNISRHFPKDLPFGMSARVKGKCEYSDTSFHYFYGEEYGNGYAWVFPIGEDIWNVGVYGCERSKMKELYFSFEKKIFNHSETVYDRTPKGAWIGATKEKRMNGSDFYFAGDCAYSARYDTGEGISFAIKDGMNIAHEIITKKRKND